MQNFPGDSENCNHIHVWVNWKGQKVKLRSNTCAHFVFQTLPWKMAPGFKLATCEKSGSCRLLRLIPRCFWGISEFKIQNRRSNMSLFQNFRGFQAKVGPISTRCHLSGESLRKKICTSPRTEKTWPIWPSFAVLFCDLISLSNSATQGQIRFAYISMQGKYVFDLRIFYFNFLFI